MPAKKGFVVPEFAALELLREQVRRHPELLLEGAQLCRKVFQVLPVPLGGIVKELGDGLVNDGILSSQLHQLSQGFELFFKTRLVLHALLALRYNYTQASKSECMRFVHSCCSLVLFFSSDAFDSGCDLRLIIEVRQLVQPRSVCL